MAEMDDVQLGSIVSGEITDALNHFDSEYTQDRLRALDFYLGEPLGNEVDGRSAVVATELADTVEAIMPNLMRVFTTNDKYVRFAPRLGEDVEAAEQASDYVNYIIQNQNDGYKLLHTFFKDALLFRAGVIKFFYEEVDEVDEEEYNGLTEAELVLLLNDPNIEIVEQRETVMSSYTDEEGDEVPVDVDYDLSVRVTRKSGQIKAINVPPEEFLVSRHCRQSRRLSLRRAPDIDDCVGACGDGLRPRHHRAVRRRERTRHRPRGEQPLQDLRRRQALIQRTRPCARLSITSAS